MEENTTEDNTIKEIGTLFESKKKKEIYFKLLRICNLFSKNYIGYKSKVDKNKYIKKKKNFK